MEVKIIRSSRRLRTVSARLANDTLLISVPLVLSQKRLEKIVTAFKTKFQNKKLKEELDKKQSLYEVAGRLNKKYFSNKLKINSIEYATGQNCKFGCCNFKDANIRISHKLGLMPKWVRDYVIVHEMAHLIEPNHSKAFWGIVTRYKRTERAKGYLMAAKLGTDFESEPEPGLGTKCPTIPRFGKL